VVTGNNTIRHSAFKLIFAFHSNYVISQRQRFCLTPIEFHEDLYRQKTGVLTLSYGVVSVIRLAVLVEHRLWHRQTDRQTGRQTKKLTHDYRIYRASIATRGKKFTHPMWTIKSVEIFGKFLATWGKCSLRPDAMRFVAWRCGAALHGVLCERSLEVGGPGPPAVSSGMRTMKRKSDRLAWVKVNVSCYFWFALLWFLLQLL